MNLQAVLETQSALWHCYKKARQAGKLMILILKGAVLIDPWGSTLARESEHWPVSTDLWLWVTFSAATSTSAILHKIQAT